MEEKSLEKIRSGISGLGEVVTGALLYSPVADTLLELAQNIDKNTGNIEGALYGIGKTLYIGLHIARYTGMTTGGILFLYGIKDVYKSSNITENFKEQWKKIRKV